MKRSSGLILIFLPLTSLLLLDLPRIEDVPVRIYLVVDTGNTARIYTDEINAFARMASEWLRGARATSVDVHSGDYFEDEKEYAGNTVQKNLTNLDLVAVTYDFTGPYMKSFPNETRSDWLNSLFDVTHDLVSVTKKPVMHEALQLLIDMLQPDDVMQLASTLSVNVVLLLTSGEMEKPEKSAVLLQKIRNITINLAVVITDYDADVEEFAEGTGLSSDSIALLTNLDSKSVVNDYLDKEVVSKVAQFEFPVQLIDFVKESRFNTSMFALETTTSLAMTSNNFSSLPDGQTEGQTESSATPSPTTPALAGPAVTQITFFATSPVQKVSKIVEYPSGVEYTLSGTELPKQISITKLTEIFDTLPTLSVRYGNSNQFTALPTKVRNRSTTFASTRSTPPAPRIFRNTTTPSHPTTTGIFDFLLRAPYFTPKKATWELEQSTSVSDSSTSSTSVVEKTSKKAFDSAENLDVDGDGLLSMSEMQRRTTPAELKVFRTPSSGFNSDTTSSSHNDRTVGKGIIDTDTDQHTGEDSSRSMKKKEKNEELQNTTPAELDFFRSPSRSLDSPKTTATPTAEEMIEHSFRIPTLATTEPSISEHDFSTLSRSEVSDHTEDVIGTTSGKRISAVGNDFTKSVEQEILDSFKVPTTLSANPTTATIEQTENTTAVFSNEFSSSEEPTTVDLWENDPHTTSKSPTTPHTTTPNATIETTVDSAEQTSWHSSYLYVIGFLVFLFLCPICLSICWYLCKRDPRGQYSAVTARPSMPVHMRPTVEHPLLVEGTYTRPKRCAEIKTYHHKQTTTHVV